LSACDSLVNPSNVDPSYGASWSNVDDNVSSD
jgi:hypothetical protein